MALIVEHGVAPLDASFVDLEILVCRASENMNVLTFIFAQEVRPYKGRNGISQRFARVGSSAEPRSGDRRTKCEQAQPALH